MPESDLNAFKKWVQEGKGNRSVTIHIGEYHNENFLSIYAYDSNLNEGQAVNSVDEIDIEKIKEAHEKEEYEKLKAKYGR